MVSKQYLFASKRKLQIHLSSTLLQKKSRPVRLGPLMNDVPDDDWQLLLYPGGAAASILAELGATRYRIPINEWYYQPGGGVPGYY